MRNLLLRFAKDDTGVTAIEYGLIASLIAVVIITSVTLVGTNLIAKFGAPSVMRPDESVIWLALLNGDFGLLNLLLRTLFHVQGPGWLTDARFVIPSIAIVTI